MDRITTYQASQSVLAQIMSAEVRQNQAQAQVASGKLASDLAGFAGGADLVTAAQGAKTRLDAYVESTLILSSKLEAQANGLSQVASAGAAAREAVGQAVSSGNALGLMQTLQRALTSAIGALNSKFAGAYLFAGGQAHTPPIAVSTLADLAATPVAGVFKNDRLRAQAQLDDETRLQTGLLASDIAQPLFAALQAIQAFSAGPSGPLNGQMTQAQSDFLRSTLATFDGASQNVTDLQAQNGGVQQQVSEKTAELQTRQSATAAFLSSLTDVDVAQAATKLNQAQLALQAAAKVASILQGASLLNQLGAPGSSG